MESEKLTELKDGIRLHRRLSSVESMCRKAKLCNECYQNYADPPSRLCPGCQAYQDHTR